MGPMFSAGHDMGSKVAMEEFQSHPTRFENGGTRKATEQRMLQEWHYYFENTLRWRNLRKITIAEVHGTVFAAGLMLMWACDLIVAADDVSFADVVGTRLGMCGIEYFGHPWEFGPRKTKELMLTGDSLSVDEAHQLGMVSKVFPADELREKTFEFAQRIADLPTMTALLIKESVNQTVDNMGFYNSLQSCFTLHQLNHAHWAEVHADSGAYPVALPEDGIQDWRTAPPVKPAAKSEP
jgi:enoyl-CoA hydratase